MSFRPGLVNKGKPPRNRYTHVFLISQNSLNWEFSLQLLSSVASPATRQYQLSAIMRKPNIRNPWTFKMRFSRMKPFDEEEHRGEVQMIEVARDLLSLRSYALSHDTGYRVIGDYARLDRDKRTFGISRHEAKMQILAMVCQRHDERLGEAQVRAELMRRKDALCKMQHEILRERHRVHRLHVKMAQTIERAQLDAFVREFSDDISRFRYADTCVPQSAEDSLRMRAVRENQQRLIAAQKEEALRKAESSKRQRSERILAQRDKRVPALESEDTHDAQVGPLLPFAIVGGAFLAKNVVKIGKRVNKALVGLAGTVQDVSSEVQKFVKETVPIASGFVTSIKNAVESIQHHFEALRQRSKSPLFLIPAAVVAFLLVTSVFKHSIVGKMLVVAGFSLFVGPEMWDRVAKIFRDSDVESPHIYGTGAEVGVELVDMSSVSSGSADFDDTFVAQAGVTNALPALLTTVFTFGIFKNGLSQRTMAECLKRVALVPRAKDGFEAIIDWSLAATESLVNFFREKAGKSTISLRHAKHPALRDWCRKVDELDGKLARSSQINYYDLRELSDLSLKGIELKRVYANDLRYGPFIQGYLARCHSRLALHVGVFNSSDNCRVEPVLAMFTGSPGTGKTMLLQFLATALIIRAELLRPNATPEEIKANIWQKGSSKFWEGYVRQAVLVLDDFGQERFVATGDGNEPTNIIRLVSNWAAPLDMASVEAKGKFSFNSPLIIGTTNHNSLRDFAEHGIYTPDAMLRRISHSYELVVKAPYRVVGTERLDFDKYTTELAKLSGKTGFASQPFHIWEVYRHDYRLGVRVGGDAMSVEQVIVEMTESLKSRAREHIRGMSNLDSFILGMHAENNATAQAGGDEFEGSSSTSGKNWLLYKELMKCVDEGTMTTREVEECLENTLQFQEAYREGYNLENLCAEEELEEKRELTLWQAFLVNFGAVTLTLALFRLIVFPIVGAIKGAVCMLLAALGIKKCRKNNFKENGTKQRFVPKTVRMRPAQAQSNINARGLDARSGSSMPHIVRDNATFTEQNGFRVVDTIFANGWKMFVRSPNCLEEVGTITYLTNNLAVMPHHFIDSLMRFAIASTFDNSTCSVELINNVCPKNRISMPLATFLEQESFERRDIDLVFIRMKSLLAPRTIIQNFLKREDIKHVTGKRVRMNVNGLKQPDASDFPISFAEHADCYWHEDPVRYAQRELKKAIAYQFPCYSGYCGNVLTLVDGNHYSGRVAFGVHVATPRGADACRIGVSTIVTQEDIEEARLKLEVVTDVSRDTFEAQGFQVEDSFDHFLEDGGSMLPLYKIDKAYPLPMRSKFYPTSYHGCIGEHSLKPAILSPVYRGEQLVYPMANAIKPYTSPMLCLDREKLRQALHVAMRPFNQWSKHQSREVLSFEEAVLGVPSLKFRSIPRGTSAGFPYVFTMRKGKVEFFGEEQDYDLTTPAAQELKRNTDEIIADASRGIRRGHVFLDFLKDELRKPEKVEAVATRLISSAPLDLTVCTRRLTGSFSAAAMGCPAACGLAPGINVYTEWDNLANFLQRKGSKVFAGDVKGLDASEQTDLLILISEYINDWYGDSAENQLAREVLLMELYHSRHLGGNGRDQSHIYQWNKSMPSGHPLTTIVNSIYTLTCLVACYIEATGDHTGFWEHVNSVTYGDDNVTNIDDAVCEVFNQVTVAKYMKELVGITFTSDKKDGVLIPYTDMSEVTFLKRSFFLDRDGVYNAPLDLESFLYTFYWCRNKKDEQEIIDSVLETALCELSLHPPHMWDLWAPQLLRIIRVRKGALTTRCAPNRVSYRNMVRTRGDSWF